MTPTKSLVQFFQLRTLRTSSLVQESQAGRYKPTRDRSRPLTYEMSQKPDRIAHSKSWNSWNTTGILGGLREPETVLEDLFIRKFMIGTFPEMILSEVIIKRQYNLVRIAALLEAKIMPHKVYFLIGYTEELLSYWLKCPVKLELQSVKNREDTIYKYI